MVLDVILVYFLLYVFFRKMLYMVTVKSLIKRSVASDLELQCLPMSHILVVSVTVMQWIHVTSCHKIQVIIWPRCASRSFWSRDSHICMITFSPTANITNHCHYHLEAHLDHFINVLLHPDITLKVSIMSVFL